MTDATAHRVARYSPIRRILLPGTTPQAPLTSMRLLAAVGLAAVLWLIFELSGSHLAQLCALPFAVLGWGNLTRLEATSHPERAMRATQFPSLLSAVLGLICATAVLVALALLRFPGGVGLALYAAFVLPIEVARWITIRHTAREQQGFA